MKVTLRQEERSLTVSCEPKDLDGHSPTTCVWFRFSRPLRLTPTRSALLAYVLFEPFIGNMLELEGVAAPAHLAAALQRVFPNDELFVTNVDNVAQRILPQGQEKSGWLAETGLQYPTALSTGQRVSWNPTELGCAVVAGGDRPLVTIDTNLRLHAAASCIDARLLWNVVVLLLTCESFGAYDLVLSESLADDPDTDRFITLLQEIGGRAHFSRPENRVA